jgi:hypothetical protein
LSAFGKPGGQLLRELLHKVQFNLDVLRTLVVESSTSASR